MAYIGKTPSSGIRNRFIYTATAGQTTFSGTDDHSRTLSYTDAEFTDVFLNGVKLDKSDYTATSGTSIVLDEGAAVDDILEVLAFDTFSVFSGEFSQDVTVGGTLDANGNVDIAGDTTMTGDLTVDTDTLYVDSTNNQTGIGTTSPTSTLHVKAHINSINGGLALESNDGSQKATIDMNDSGNLRFYQNGNSRMRIDSSGNLLAGRTSISSREDNFDGSGSVFSGGNIFPFNTNGTSGRFVRLDGFTDALYIQWDSGTADAGGVKLNYGATSFVSSSDERLKENIQSLDTGSAYNFVKTVRATTFEWKTDAVDGTHLGFIAQDWEQQYPELVSNNELTRVTTDDGDEAAKGLLYSETVVVLTAALKEAITKIETLETKVAALEASD